MTTASLILAILTGTCQVRIDNPERFDLVLHRVIDDESPTLESLGDGSGHKLALPFGHYWIDARKGKDEVRVRLSVPLPRRAIRPLLLKVRVASPPPPRKGWCWIPSGPSLRGDVIGVGQEDERPARILHVPGFWLGRTEVTNAQYVAFLNGQTRIDPIWLNIESRKLRIQRRGDRWTTDAPEQPVVTVSWYGADAYCSWLTARTGNKHRLPTETEWEKAARGPESFVYSYGNIYRNAGANQESGTIRPVGCFPANGHGLVDMTGNAYEWVQDIFDPDALSTAQPRTLAPKDPDGVPRHRTLRGGSFVLDGMYLRNSFRMRHRPSVQADDFGFRVLMEGGTRRRSPR